MQCVVNLACDSYPNFWVLLHHGVDVIVYSVMGHNKVVILSSGGLHALLMQKLHFTPLAAHPDVQKTIDLLFAQI